MNPLRALAWKEARQLFPNLVALSMLSVVLPLMLAGIASYQNWHQDAIQAVALTVLAMVAMVLGATTGTGDGAPSFEAMLPLSRRKAVLVKLGLRVAALAVLCALVLASLAVVASGPVLPSMDGASRVHVLAWIVAPMLAAALASAFRKRPVAAAIDAPWVLIVAALVSLPMIALSQVTWGWGTALLLGLAAFMAASSPRTQHVQWGMGFLRFLTIATLCLTLLAVIWIVGGGMVAKSRLERARTNWESVVGPLDALQRHPDAPANAAALELEAALAPMGLSLEPRTYPSKLAVETKAQKACNNAINVAHDKLLRAADPRSVVIPDETALCIAQHGAELEKVRAIVLANEPPVQARSLSLGFMSPIPNLLSHVRLQRLLALDALTASRAGNAEQAAADMETAIRITRGLREQPAPISQLIAVAGSRSQAIVLRALDGVPASLVDRIDAKAARDAFEDALRNEAWGWFEMAGPRGDALAEGMQSRGESLAQVITSRVVVALTRPVARMSAARLLEAEAAYFASARNKSSCELVFEPLPPKSQVTIQTQWLPGLHYLDTTLGTPHLKRAAALALELELTRDVLARRNAGAAQLASSVCPGKSWRETQVAGGSFALEIWEVPEMPADWKAASFRYEERAP